MKKIILMTLATLAVSCASKMPGSREIASAKNLTGTFIGQAEYKFGHKGPNTAAIRVYFAPIAGKQDAYNVVLLEYVDLLKMAPSYVASNKAPDLVGKLGLNYLKDITKNISAYEATPGKAPHTFELRPLMATKNKILVNGSAEPRILTLSEDKGLENVFQGATLSSAKPDEPEQIYFPKKGEFGSIQYETAKAAYGIPKLESTWHKRFLKGPYYSQYYKKDDIVLRTSKDKDGQNFATYSYGNVGKMNQADRAKVFTNEKSGHLKGKFLLTEARPGMFLSHNINADYHTLEIVEGRITMFIDVFDANKSLHQDVVEVTMINPEDPEDFLMYYEDPDNGMKKY